MKPFSTSDGSNTILSNIDRTRTSFFEHQTNSNVFICWWSNSNTLFLASNDRTSNFKPNIAFTTWTKSLIELTWTSFFRTSNKLKRVHLMVIERKHPIFGFERSNIKLWALFDPSLIFYLEIDCAHVDKMKPRNTTFLPLATSTDSINCRSAKNHVTQSPQATLNTVYTGC